MSESSLHDISRRISEETAVWPGDTPFSRRYVMRLSQGMSCNTSTLTLSAHTGSHADAPAHFVEGAAGIDQVSLLPYLGRCRVLEARDPRCVTLADLSGLDLREEERLLFKTFNPPQDNLWQDDFAFVSLDAAQAAAAGGLKLLGLDTPSVDPMDSKSLHAHKALLAGGVAILESLDLAQVPPGIFELIALPLKIVGGDASPVRAILRPWREPLP